MEQNSNDSSELSKALGYGNIGVIQMPTRTKEGQHKTFSNVDKSKIEMLMFGGTPYEGEETNQTYKLDIDLNTQKFQLTHLPDCQLPTNDKFIDNQFLHLNEDLGEVSFVGKYGVHRINTAAPLDRLQWKKCNHVSGYDGNIENQKLPHYYRMMSEKKNQ